MLHSSNDGNRFVRSRRAFLRLTVIAAGGSVLAACTQPAAQPTAAPAKPAAKPTTAPAAKPAATTAPAAKTAASPAASPAAKAAAKPGEFDVSQVQPETGAGDPDLQKLIEGAKAEGEINLYSVQSGRDLVRSDPEFKALYPFLTMNRFRTEGEALGAKLMEEARGGQHIADILDVDQNVTNAVAQAGLLAEYDPPERAEMEDQLKRPTFTAYRIQLKPISYNTNLVSEAEAPKTYEDLLDPKWKDKVVMEADEVSVFGATVETWGEPEAVRYWTALTENGLQFRAGQSAIIELLSAGEFPIAVSANLHSIEQQKLAGAPMAWVNTKPIFGNFGAISTPKDAPHPNAARLFIRYLLSTRGQEAVAATFRVPANPAVKPRAERLAQEGFEMKVAGDLVMNEYERMNRLYYQTTKRPFT